MAEKERKKHDVVVSARLPKAVLEMMRESISVDLHVSDSDFLRDAVKYYIEHNWPVIYAKHSGRRAGEKEEPK